MELSGMHFVAGAAEAGTGETFHAMNPVVGEELPSESCV